MADFPHFTKFLHFRSSSLSSPLFFPLHNFSSLRRRLSLSSLHPPLSSSSNSPNLLLISTSLKSDGSLVFKFGDASELPPAVEIDDSSDTVSVGAEIEVESEIGSDVDLAGTDNVDSVGKLDDDVDGDIAEDDEQNRDDLVPTSEIEDSVDVKSVNQNDDVDDEQNRDDLVSTLEIEDSVGAQTVNQNDDVDDDQNHDDLVLISEIEDSVGAQTVNQNDDVDDDQNHADLVPTSEVEASVGAQTVNQNDDVDDDQNHDDLVPTAEIEDSVGARTVNQNNDVDDDIAKDDEHNHDVPTSEIEHSVGAQTVNHNDAIAAVTDDDFGLNDSSIDVRNNLDSISEVALQNEEVDDRDSVVKHDDVDEGVEMTELPLVQSEAEPILDEEVNDADLPTIGGPEDSPTVDHADEASPSLVKPAVTSIETIVDRVLPREEISSDSGDISASSISMSSASASLSPPLKVTDAVPSAILQSDDCTERRDISEPAGPNSGPGSNSLGTASAEANIDSVQSSTVAVSAPSATASLQQAIEVNDAATPSIQQSDDIYVAAEPGPGISVTTEISLGEEISAPSLRLVSAAASLAHSAEALAGGDDAYFVCENWFGVADGVGQWSFGGTNKGLYAQEFIQNCESLARKSLDTGSNNFKELFQQSAAMTESSGAARVLVAHIAEQVLHVANIGDTGFLVIRNGTVFMKSSPMFHEFNFPHAISSGDNPVEAAEEYHVELKDGDIIVTATDGLFDNIYEHDIVSLVCEAVEDGKNLKDVAERLAYRSQEVGRSPNAKTPFSDAAQAAGHPEFSGGKFDHVTVIVSAVQKK